jgi:hypothetical protein
MMMMMMLIIIIIIIIIIINTKVLKIYLVWKISGKIK